LRWNKYPIFIVVLVVSGEPVSPADIAELVAAQASHVITPFELVNDHFASRTLTIVKVFLEELELKLVTVTLMIG
jgi:hypothetical protein